MLIRSLIRFPFALACVLPLACAQSYVIPQVADGGGWRTTLAITNTTVGVATAVLTCHRETSDGATMAWDIAFRESTSSSLSIPAASTLFLHTTGADSTVSAGWCELRADSGLEAYAVFTATGAGTLFEGTALAAQAGDRSLIPFDNTGELTTSMAIVNAGSTDAEISVNIRTDDGAVVRTALGVLPAYGHLAFELPGKFSATAGQRGLIEFYTESGSISAIALRFNSTGAFTSAPAYPAFGSPIVGETSSGPAVLENLTLSASSVAAGGSVTGAVTLSAAAPTGGAVVTLSSNNTAAVSLPASVTVPAGAATASFMVTTNGVGPALSATLTATYAGASASAILNISASGKAVSFSRMVCAMTFQPTGQPSSTLSLTVTPDTDNIGLSGSLGLTPNLSSGVSTQAQLRGYSSDGGTAFLFNRLSSGGLGSTFNVGTTVYTLTAANLSATLSNLLKGSTSTTAKAAMTLTLTGTPASGSGGATTLSGSIRSSGSTDCTIY